MVGSTRRGAKSGADSTGNMTQGELEAAVQKAVKDILTEMMKDHRKQTNEAVSGVQESVDSVDKGLRDQLAALLERVGELESDKANSQPGPVENNSFSNKGIYPTMEEMQRHKDGEIKVRMGG